MQQLRIGDIVRITQPLYARLYTRWYDTREQRLITNSVGKMAQVRSVYKYNGQYRYRLRIEGMRSHTRYGFEMSEIEYVSQPPEPFPKHMFEPGEKVVVSTGNPVTDNHDEWLNVSRILVNSGTFVTDLTIVLNIILTNN